MAGSKRTNDDPGLLRLQRDIARDRLRIQQDVSPLEEDCAVNDAPRGSSVGRLYQVFVAMGEA